MAASNEELEQRIEMLQLQCDEITKTLVAIDSVSMATTKRRIADNAHYSALRSMVGEIALRFGISSEQFWKHYEARYSYYHDLMLQQAEKVKPRLAAQLDDRPLADIPTGRFPPLFP
jgi:hypothetical protein